MEPNNQPQELQVLKSDDTQLYLMAKAEIDMQISTAKAFPRSLTVFLKKAETMATLSEDIAGSCCYALPRGNKTIEGPSIRLAEIIVSAYGNVRCAAKVIYNDGRTITAQGTCHDLENNIAAQVEVKRSILQHEWKFNQATGKNEKTGKMVPMNDDMQVMVGNAACAIAYRNAVYKVIPAALISDVYEKAKQVARGDAETLVSRRNKAIEYFRTLGVKDEQICAVLEIKKVEDIDLDKLQTLTGMRSAIRNNESTVKELFEPAPPTPEDKAKAGEQATLDMMNKKGK